MTEKRRRLPSQRTILLVAAMLLLAALIWILGPGARWVVDFDVDVTRLPEKDLAVAADAIRGRALAIATGVVALAAVYYTARNAETARRAVELTQQTSTRTLELTEQGQVTDRYTKAIQQLGDPDNLHIRIGGIYALERIARDSERDHRTIQEVLTAFVREYKPEAEQPSTQATGNPTPKAADVPSKVPADVQAALSVIGRTHMMSVDLSGAKLSGANLSEASLAGADLIGTDLGGVNLGGADLTGAKLSGAKLSGANLSGANLEGADLIGTDLTGADLIGAKLTNANLRDTKMPRADLIGTDLTGADLAGADLSGANLARADLVRADLSGAKLSGAKLINTRLRGTNLFRADLSGADLLGAQLTRAQYDMAATTERATPPHYFLDDLSKMRVQPS
ncbi:pentapeptide repeat-containing protein [Nonomuraea wenchangensis]|uniref:pentapeptide repeat-containing protein n=1 Tax=Nonomuraea wenchangensis TaxID=568860 RepID=UPI00371DC572